jgi:hypothetical protein
MLVENDQLRYWRLSRRDTVLVKRAVCNRADRPHFVPTGRKKNLGGGFFLPTFRPYGPVFASNLL